MNEIDKMLANLKKNVEAEKKNKKTTKGNTDEILFALKNLTKNVNVVPKNFVRVEGNNDIEENAIDDFFICNHAVTQKEFNEIMGKNPSYFQHRKQISKELEKDTSNNPVECVSWYDAIYYCNKRSIQEGLTPVYTVSIKKITDITKWNYKPCKGENIRLAIKCKFEANGYRLPTNAEWEYAAKGGKKSKNYKYSGSDSIDEVAWYAENSKLVTHKVMQKKPNELGLYDMNGNVYEWCWDSFNNSVRYCYGGGCDYTPGSSNVNERFAYDAKQRYYFIGFRVVRSISAE